MTLSKLSLRNAKRQARDYLVYFVTIVMAAALIYAFNGLVFSQEIANLSSMMNSLPLVVVLTSIVVVSIIGWLVSYTTKFMLKRRSRELGTYILIGLENQQVARLFFRENLAVGGVAFVLGLLLGNLLFQALRAITLSLFQVTYTFSFSFLPGAVFLSLFYFALIYLYALFKSRRAIKKMKICDLLNLDRENEGELLHKERARRRVFVLSILMGIAGTLLILTYSLFTALLGAALLIAFLYGFFISFSSGVPAYFNKRPEQKFRGHTLLVFRTLSAKLATMGVVMATIALLFTATLIAEGSGLVFNALFQSRAEQTTCFDLFIGSTDLTEDSLDGYVSYIDANIPVREARRYEVYLADNAQVLDYIETTTANYYRDFTTDTLMKASDYAALRAMAGYPPVELEPGEYTMHCMGYLKSPLMAYTEPIQVGGQTLAPGKVYTESFTQSLWDGNGRGYILVVPDEALAGQPVSHTIYAAMTEAPVIGPSFTGLRNMRDEKSESQPNHNYDTLFSKAVIEAENVSSYATIVFPLYYLALVLTMVSATILTIQQLSETDHYRRQFQLLHNLGMDRREMGRALRKQFAIFYALPSVPPVLIGVPFITALCNAVENGVMDGPGEIAAIVGFALALFLGIYLIYILTAYTSLKRSVLPSEGV